ncbi:unnamed protein product [Menidia menidia]|uniref:(Atlantic silverside) hypothetical protein n=1 Tax=Menidia menidia TaxID=238744 RepID=A0A8S4BG77_9TELE|nr:unnamed protein product [Menidia menidia]
MESPPDPASDPGNSASEPATPVRETPVNLETLRKADHPAPVRRQTCSSTNRELRCEPLVFGGSSDSPDHGADTVTDVTFYSEREINQLSNNSESTTGTVFFSCPNGPAPCNPTRYGQSVENFDCSCAKQPPQQLEFV